MDNYKNFAIVTVNGTYSSSATSINLANGDGNRCPASPCNGVWYNATTYPNPADDPNREIIRKTSGSADTITVVRGQQLADGEDGGLPASAKNTAGVTYKIIFGLTAKTIADLMMGTIDVGEETIWVTERGAVGDGTTDDTAAIQDALDDGNDIIFPPGTWLVAGGLNLHDNIRVRGAGIGATTIKLKNSAGAVSVINTDDAVNWTIQDLTIDGNELQNSSALDGVRVNGSYTGKLLNVQVLSCRRHGIALGANASGDEVWNTTIDGCEVRECRGDLVHIENKNNTNKDVRVVNCYLLSPGYSDGSGKAGIVASGPVLIANCTIEDVVGSRSNLGVYLRDDDGTAGNGAHDSHVTNVHVVGTTHATNVSEGIKADCDRVSIIGCSVDGCDYGFHLSGDSNTVSGSSAKGCDNAARIAGDYNRVLSSYLSATGSGNVVVDYRATADEGVLRDNRIVELSSATKVTVSGTNLHAKHNVGWKTHTLVDSGDMAGNAGNADKTIAHGLAITPSKYRCMATVSIVSGVPLTESDWRLSELNIVGTDSTNVTVYHRLTANDVDLTWRIVLLIDEYP